MSLQQLQQLPNRPIVRNRIRNRDNSLEPKYTIRITPHHTSAIRTLPVRVLDIIMSRAIRLPDIDLNALNRIPLLILDCADNETGLAFFVVGH